jgi:hypothetical protein
LFKLLVDGAAPIYGVYVTLTPEIMFRSLALSPKYRL